MRAKQVNDMIKSVEATLGQKIQTLGAYVMQLSKKKKINPVELDDLGTRYRDILHSLDVQQHGQRLVWKGLPDYLPGWQIENMKYYRGSLAGVIVAGVMYVLPYTSTAGVGAYGNPNAVDLISYNGTREYNRQSTNDTSADKKLSGMQGFQTLINNDGTLNPNARAAILYDRIPEWSNALGCAPRSILVRPLINDSAEMLGRVKINLQNSTGKITFYIDDEQQRAPLEEDLDRYYGSSKPYLIVKRNAGAEDDGKQFPGKTDMETQALFECFQSLNSIRCMTLGIPNNGAFEKKERKITGELDADAQTALALAASRDMGKLWCEQMRIIYGEEYPDLVNDLDCDISEDLKEQVEEKLNEMQQSAKDSHPGEDYGGNDND